MRANQVDTVLIFLDISLVMCLVLASLPSAQSYSKTQGPSELTRNLNLSSPEECARKCHVGKPPKICYYHFIMELYTVLGHACGHCTPNYTNPILNNCQCVTADGFERGILTVNRMIPGPSIQVCQGDKVVIDVANHMEGMETTIHWHGILQKGYQYYDGVPMVTQCPISQGTTFRYQWVAKNSGTHFWHSHDGLQRMDGIYGSIIVREPTAKDPSRHLYDKDKSSHTILLSDWMHEQATERFPGRLLNHPGQDPESILINGKGQYTDPITGSRTNTPLEVFTVEPGRRYRFRMINAFSTTCSTQLIIEGHVLTVIATDGEAVHPVNVNSIISFSGERYDFVINATQTRGAYWIQVRGLGGCSANRVQQLAILRYTGRYHKPRSEPPTYDKGLFQGVVLNPLDGICDRPRKDAICINQLKHARPVDKGILGPDPDFKIFLPFKFYTYTNKELSQPGTYSTFLAPTPRVSRASLVIDGIDFPLDATFDIILIDEDAVPDLSHPFHLHGYAFNVVGMGRHPDKNVTKITLNHVRDLDRKGLIKRNLKMLPFKDTIPVPTNGYVVLRFRADNPGEWLFHCHFMYHVAIGMAGRNNPCRYSRRSSTNPKGLSCLRKLLTSNQTRQGRFDMPIRTQTPAI